MTCLLAVCCKTLPVIGWVEMLCSAVVWSDQWLGSQNQ